MEKMIKKMMVAGLACVALCGSAMAAPKHGNGPAPKGKAPMVQTVHHETRKPVQAHKPAPAHHQAKTPARPVPHNHVAHHPAPHGYTAAARHVRRPVTPCHRHHRHECTDCHYDDNDWIELGAGIIVTAALAGLAI